MRFVLVFLIISCSLIGIFGAVGAGAIWNNDINDPHGIGAFLCATAFIGIGASFSYRLGTKKQHRLFFPQRYWWQ